MNSDTAIGLQSMEKLDETAAESLDLLAARLIDNQDANTGQTPPVDRRIEQFLANHFADIELEQPLQLPRNAIGLTRSGVARALSLPRNRDTYTNGYVRSFRVRNGVLHNPRSDRRTTKGTFHVTEGGLPIAGDKKAVPKAVFARLFQHALLSPPEDLEIPFASHEATPARGFLSLLLRPIVSPEVPGVCHRKTMEVRFFAPGSLVSNLDFVESIFGNAGDPHDPVNDAGLDVEHWTGHTGCVILAPHLTRLTKKELGLPSWDQATDRQRRDGMCWRDPVERYNEGQAFKLTCRTTDGVIVTLIADNYFGYCKKEVKTQISFAANLYGGVEEEHAGGAVAFASYNLGYEFDAADYTLNGRTVDDLVWDDRESILPQPGGYAIDRELPDLVYIPGHAKGNVGRLEFWWKHDGQEITLPISPDKTYMTPSGYKVHLEKHPGAASWRLIGTRAEGTVCHKPCTVSGGGKSEISKGLRDFMIYGPIFVADKDRDFELVQKIFDHDYTNRWKPGRGPDYSDHSSRPVLSPKRSLGSVVKLLTPSDDFTDEYNDWLASFPNYIFPIVFIIKRFLRQDQVAHWRQIFGVDTINGFPGHELKAFQRKLVGTYLRVGLLSSEDWRTFKLRQDFSPAIKIQTEDDITASIVVPGDWLDPRPVVNPGISHKFIVNCESRLFQRPDEAIHRGLDRQAESDLAQHDNFLSNFEALSAEQARTLVSRVTEFDEFTPPMQQILRETADASTGYVVCSSKPRLVDGQPSKNPRYLQTRPDLVDPRPSYIAQRGMRLLRGLRADQPLYTPVNAVMVGRRNNPPDAEHGIRPLCVYGPIHYQELPELFMDFICSLTGKSPSTTGAGSEGALTKGPFNALRPIADLNAALVSYILTGLAGFSTAAGYVGPNLRVDHDISLLIPEIWCRLTPEERNPRYLIEEGHLERLEDFEHAGKPVLASRLGYRISAKFVRSFFGRVFDHPHRVFDEAFLRPESQDLDAFADGVWNITEAQKRVAQQYFEDGSIDHACPPLQALLKIMIGESPGGLTINDPALRNLFRLDSLLQSDWYRKRLEAKQRTDERLWTRHQAYLEQVLDQSSTTDDSFRPEIHRRLEQSRRELDRIRSADYLSRLRGTLGLDPVLIPSS